MDEPLITWRDAVIAPWVSSILPFTGLPEGQRRAAGSCSTAGSKGLRENTSRSIGSKWLRGCVG